MSLACLPDLRVIKVNGWESTSQNFGFWGKEKRKFLGQLMSNTYKEMRKVYCFRNSIAFVLLVVFFCCFLVLLISMLRVPDPAVGNGAMPFYKDINILKVSYDENSFGTFGDMMIQMLPQDLAFTVFIPSQTAFDRDLRLRANDSFNGEKMNDDTYAVISRLLGFSAVPRILDSAKIPVNGEVSYDALSGFTLFISKDAGGLLVVNGVKAEKIDIRRGKLVVHVMDGILMDAEFEQSIQPDFDGDD